MVGGPSLRTYWAQDVRGLTMCVVGWLPLASRFCRV